MLDENVRQKVVSLRTQGCTYKEINNALGMKLPKSTLSYVCSDIKKTPYYFNKINILKKENLKKAQKSAVLSNKKNRDILLEQINNKNYALLRSVKVLNQDTLKIILSILYLGEGSKWKSHKGLMLGSSDPYIINLYIKLLKSCYNIGADTLKCRVSYRADQNINELEKSWSKLIGIPRKSFYKTKPDLRTVGSKTKKKDYIGVCVVSCGGTKIQLELENLARQIGPLVQR